ncbi:hypothetical protein ACV34G_31495, partial [Pseudomonas aeruginosa]
ITNSQSNATLAHALFQILLAPLEAQSFGWAKEIPYPIAEYFLLKHGGWPATVCPIIKGGLNDQAVDHSHAVPAARQLHDPQG